MSNDRFWNLSDQQKSLKDELGKSKVEMRQQATHLSDVSKHLTGQFNP